jgi:hypothetical protein
MLLFSGVKKLVVVGRILQLPAENTKGGLSLSQTVAINGLNFMVNTHGFDGRMFIL